MPKPIETTGLPLKIRYRPEGETDMDALAFAEYIKQSISAVRQTAALLAGREIRVRYTIGRLYKASPEEVDLNPVVAIADKELIHRAHLTHVATLERLQSGVIPDYLDYPARLTYQRLGQLSKTANFRTDVAANGSSATVGSSVKNTLDLQLQSEHSSYGSVRGFIQTYQSAGGRRLIRIVPRVGESLVGQFRESDRALVRSLIDVAYVEAEGETRYRSGEYQPYFIKVDKFSKLDLEGAPTFRDMDGFAPSLTRGLSSDEFVTEIREAW